MRRAINRESWRVVRAVSMPMGMLENIRRYPDVNWSEIARQAFARKLHLLEVGGKHGS